MSKFESIQDYSPHSPIQTKTDRAYTVWAVAVDEQNWSDSTSD
jgi:hypothetical protein